ncbi:hypothetical protein BaRGS_00020745, partial [Batillaria attramentaria]
MGYDNTLTETERPSHFSQQRAVNYTNTEPRPDLRGDGESYQNVETASSFYTNVYDQTGAVENAHTYTSLTVRRSADLTPCHENVDSRFPVFSVDPDASGCPQYVTEGASLYCECRAVNVENVQGSLPVASWPGQSANYQLSLTNVRREQNGTEFTCQVTLGDETKTTVYVMQVAYGPMDETVTILGPDVFPTDGSKNLTLTCEATEVNPIPEFSWSGAICDEGNNGRTCTFRPEAPGDDGKRVSCRVTNRNTTPNPTIGETLFSVNVTFKASVLRFSMNDSTDDVTMNESDMADVELKCAATGRPRPNITLERQGDATPLRRGESDELSFRMSRVTCEKMGTYTCIADNGYPNPSQMSLRLTVYLPNTFTFSFHGSQSSNPGQVVSSGMFSTTCIQSDVEDYLVTCQVKAYDVRAEDFGVYSMTLDNGLGTLDYYFTVDITEENGDPEDSAKSQDDDEVLEEHINVTYVSADDIDQNSNSQSSPRKKSPDSVALSSAQSTGAYDDVSDVRAKNNEENETDFGYSSVNGGNVQTGLEAGKDSEPSQEVFAETDTYASVDEDRPRPSPAPRSIQGTAYAVVEINSNAERPAHDPVLQSDDYVALATSSAREDTKDPGHDNEGEPRSQTPDTTVGPLGDIYSQVDRASKKNKKNPAQTKVRFAEDDAQDITGPLGTSYEDISPSVGTQARQEDYEEVALASSESTTKPK